VAPLAIWFGGDDGTHGWRESLLVLSIVGLALALLWHVLARSRSGEAPRTRVSRPRWPIRDRVAWLLVLAFALRAGIFQALFTWLPAVYVERGWSITAAGLLPMAITLGGMPATLFVSRLADIGGSRRLYMGWASALLVVAVSAHIVLPGIGYLGAVFAGVCLGTLFTIALTLPLDLAERPEDVGALASMMLAGGYGVSALGPFMLGAARDLTGNFNGSLIVLALLCLVLVVVTYLMSPERLAAARSASRAA
jgi:CP family cyanate transporter-like MFS transporter